MTEIPRPAELLELADGQSLTTKVKAWVEGTLRIFPKDWEARVSEMRSRGQIDAAKAAEMIRDGKEIQVLRIVVPPGPMAPGVGYWDITSTRLISMLKPYLEKPDFKERTYKITARGIAPRKDFSMVVS